MRSCADALAAQFAPTTLDELRHTSALCERVESKYIVTWETFEALAGELLDSHRSWRSTSASSPMKRSTSIPLR